MECLVKKSDIVQSVLHHAAKTDTSSRQEKGVGYAPTNIALCKYWGKRNTELNLPVTSSLSIALPDKGALTEVSWNDKAEDVVMLNGETLAKDSEFVTRIARYLDLFRTTDKWYLKIDIKMNIPAAAGLASSACGFASLVCALNDIFQWQLSHKHLSVLARLGSGSAARSLWNGFVLWHEGMQEDGMDSHGEPIDCDWPSLRVGILTVSNAKKPISSRDAMLRTVNSSPLYSCWTRKVSQDLSILRQTIKAKNFSLLGGTAESNALTMHATMLSSWPPICYHMPETIAAMQRVWQLRESGLEVYFTQDAGPNLKLLFEEKDSDQVTSAFEQLEIVRLFD